MRIAALALMTLIAGCAAHAPAPPPSFDMSSLIRAHPLYGTLAQYDRQIAALSASLHAPDFDRKDEAFANAERAVQATLNRAASRTQAIAAMPSPDVQPLRNTARLSALSESRVRSDMQQTYRAQSRQLRATAQQDMARYRSALLSQQDSALANYERSMRARVQQAYDSRRQQLYEKESTLALDLAKADESKRLGIETKLRTLALDGARRRALQAQLTAIQAHENAIVAQQRRRDRAVLDAFLPPLQARADADIARMRTDLQKRTAANLAERERVLAAQLAGNGMRLDLGPAAADAQNGGDMQTQLDMLARAHPADPGAFTSARERLLRHFDSVAGADADATRSTWRQIGILKSERDQLYADIVSQITRDARRLAQRGLHGAALTAAVRSDLDALTQRAGRSM